MRALAAMLALVACLAGAAADFELGRPAVEMRRLQICQECREPLVVTSIAPGAAVRCPKCRHVARRLPDRELLVKVYQVCPSCGARLDVSALQPDAPLRCGACGLAQRVLPEAVHRPHSQSGTGEIPLGPRVDALPPPAPAAEDDPAALPAPRVPGLNAAVPGRQQPDVAVRPLRGPGAAPQGAPGGDYYAPLPAPEETLKVSVLVNGQPVSTAAVQQTVLRNLEILRLRDGRAPGAEELAQLKQKITEELIERELLRQAAQEAGFVPSEEAIQARLALAPNTMTRAGVKAEIILEEMKRRHALPAAPASDQAVAKYFREHRGDFLRRPRLRLRALTIYKDRSGRADRRQAEVITAEIKEKLDFGIKFSAVAARYSEDVFRAEGGLMRGSDGNDLVAVDDLAEPLCVVFAHPRPGQLFGPLQLLTGYAFCLVEKVEAAPEATLESESAHIRQLLERQAREAAFTNWLDGLKKAAVIEYQ